MKTPGKTESALELEAEVERDFGFRRGTKKNRACALYMRPQGATTDEIVAINGGPDLSLLRIVEATADWTVIRDKIVNESGRYVTRYRIVRSKIEGSATTSPTAQHEASQEEEVATRVRKLDADYSAKISTWTEGFLSYSEELAPYWYGSTAWDRAQTAIRNVLKIEPTPDWDGSIASLPESDLRKFPVYTHFRALIGYAYYGILDEDAGNALAALGGDYIDSTREDSDPSATYFPWDWADHSGELQAIFYAGLARWKIDFDIPSSPGLSAREIADLSKFDIRSVRNLLVPNAKSGLAPDRNGKVSAAAVRDWLLAKPDFLPTIDLRDRATASSSKLPNFAGDPIFVPIASDGTEFLPTSKMADGYTVALENVVKRVSDYEEALGELQSAEVVSWFEPGQTGKRIRRVWAASWRRRSRKELGL